MEFIKSSFVLKKNSNKERIKIVNMHFNNEATVSKLSKDYDIFKHTIWNWITKYKSHGYNLLDNKPKNSGNRKVENIDYKERYQILKKYQVFLKIQREKK